MSLLLYYCLVLMLLQLKTFVKGIDSLDENRVYKHMMGIIEEEEEESKIKQEEIKEEEETGDTNLLSDDDHPRKKVKVSLLLI